MQFEEIYAKYFNDVYRFLLRLSGNKDIAEEITSETFFKAMKSIDSFRGDCDLSVWLCQIAKNNYYTYLKKSRHIVSLDNQEPALIEESTPDIAEIVIDSDSAWHIKRVLHSIPDPYKEVFMWRVYAEMSFEQIGKLFGKNANWACVTYHRARKTIQNRLEEIKNEK